MFFIQRQEKKDKGLCLTNLLIGTPVSVCGSVADLVLAFSAFPMQKVPQLCHGIQWESFTELYSMLLAPCREKQCQ